MSFHLKKSLEGISIRLELSHEQFILLANHKLTLIGTQGHYLCIRRPRSLPVTAAVEERRGSGIGIGRRDDQIRLAVVNRKIQRLTDEDTFICLTTLVCDFIPLMSKVNRTGTPCSRVISPDGHCITNEKSDHASRSCLRCLSRPNVGGLARSLSPSLSRRPAVNFGN